MPTKPNSAGEQQAYDTSTGKYGSGSSSQTLTPEERKKPENSQAEKNKFNELTQKFGKEFESGDFTVKLYSQELATGGFAWETLITIGDSVLGGYKFIEPDEALILFNDKQEAKKQLDEKIRTEFELMKEKKIAETKKVNSQIKEFRQKSNEEQHEMLKNEDFFELYFSTGGRDKPLYEEVDRDSKGGYSGMSMSNRAIKSYESGQAPLSKWTKDMAMETIDERAGSDLEPLMPLIEKLSIEEIKENLLKEVAWHHTSGFFNKTPFYGLKSPKEIAYYVMHRNERKFSKFSKPL